jgi:hypothetical protein
MISADIDALKQLRRLADASLTPQTLPIITNELQSFE